MNKEIDEIYRLYAEDVYSFIFKLSRNESLVSLVSYENRLKCYRQIIVESYYLKNI